MKTTYKIVTGFSAGLLESAVNEELKTNGGFLLGAPFISKEPQCDSEEHFMVDQFNQAIIQRK